MRRARVIPAMTTAEMFTYAAGHSSEIERPATKRVARFAVPLHLAPTLNAIAEMPRWKRGNLKKAALTTMFVQSRGRSRVPLRGRPIVIAIRFSSVEPDRDSGWPKFPIDRMTTKNQGLGFFEDDRPKALDLRACWRPAPPSKGFAYFEVYESEAT